MRNLLQNPIKQVIVIKVGSHVFSREGRIVPKRIYALATQICELAEHENQVLLVVSGAALAGRDIAGLDRAHYPRQLLRPLAALGQATLIAKCDQIFRRLNQPVGQVLVSRDDFHYRERYLAVKETVQALFKLHVLPIMNENDSIGTAEQSLGDNDNLAAQMAGMLDADLLIILGTVAGFHDGNPRDPASRVIPTVPEITPEIWRQGRFKGNRHSRGGMVAKLEAIGRANHCGIPVVLADGREEDILTRIFDGQEIGTLFMASPQRLSLKKRWLAYSTRAAGQLIVDDGTCHALTRRGASLLSSGIIEVQGDFRAKEVVAVQSPTGTEFARGIVNYDHETVRRIAGRNNRELRSDPAGGEYREVVHRENIVLLPKAVKESK
ncbi:MAG: glutamate 5-kinase [Candidatus Marinimicrobia bacterium]|nr:glutamate 5-kinase [Candidatus Neomarinimicrobiota bacterium]